MAWPIAVIYISFSSILNALLYEINLFSCYSSPLKNLLLICDKSFQAFDEEAITKGILKIGNLRVTLDNIAKNWSHVTYSYSHLLITNFICQFC